MTTKPWFIDVADAGERPTRRFYATRQLAAKGRRRALAEGWELVSPIRKIAAPRASHR